MVVLVVFVMSVVALVALMVLVVISMVILVVLMVWMVVVVAAGMEPLGGMMMDGTSVSSPDTNLEVSATSASMGCRGKQKKKARKWEREKEDEGG